MVSGEAACRDLILILGDQLTPAISSLKGADPGLDRVLMAEVDEEAGYAPHHVKKLAFFFAAMRRFAEELRGAGWQVDYVRLDDQDNPGSLGAALLDAARRLRPRRVRLTEPGEHRLLAASAAWAEALDCPLDLHDDDRFVCSRAEFAAWADGRKQLRMEYFYREMRRKTGLLMDGGEPAGGAWNYDKLNRKAAPRDLFLPERLAFEPDAVTREALAMVAERFSGGVGRLDGFAFATCRADAEQALEHFIEARLAGFGDYQDAMLTGEPWMRHSLLSAYLNVGLLDPLDVCRRVEEAYREGRAPLNAAEGFIRQIIGWREYVRGVYWRFMPDYLDSNALGAERKLPSFYWTGETDMACLREAIGQTLEHAYAHHIQRLMVTGLFAMLIGVRPQEIHEWYLGVYIDAIEWVELPNVIGMSQYADGGLLASKPYAASGAYIDRMSDYCAGCAYDVKAGPGDVGGRPACPFNAL